MGRDTVVDGFRGKTSPQKVTLEQSREALGPVYIWGSAETGGAWKECPTGGQHGRSRESEEETGDGAETIGIWILFWIRWETMGNFKERGFFFKEF